MEYELALELKNAGFPQNRPLVGGGLTGGPMSNMCYFPTLSELIKECEKISDKYLHLSNFIKPGFWTVYDKNHIVYGFTPEIAFAMLWLALTLDK